MLHYEPVARRVPVSDCVVVLALVISYVSSRFEPTIVALAGTVTKLLLGGQPYLILETDAGRRLRAENGLQKLPWLGWGP